nr:hypothetical protein [Tanacetum cinerariifolium]
DTSENTKFAKQPIVENLSKVGKTNALSNPVTSNSVSTPQESKSVNNDKVIAPGMFRINPSKTSKKEKHVPNTVSASARTKPITVSRPHVITKKDVNSDLNGLSSTGVDNTKTRRPHPKSNTKHDRVLSASKSSRTKNKEAEVEEHHRNLLLSKNNKHISVACNNIQIDSQDVISKVVCTACLKCLISVNHDKCLCNYVNDKNSRGKKQMANVFVKEIQKKYQPKVTKPKKVGTLERLATPKPKKPRFLLRVYNRRTKKIMETINVSFDELLVMAFEQRSSKPRLESMTSGHISSGLNLTYAPSTITAQQPSEGEFDLLFEAMYNDYIGGQPSATARTIPPAQEPQVHQSSTTSITIADTAPIPTNSSYLATNILITSQDVNELNLHAMVDGNTTMEPKNVKKAMTDPAWLD